ncbi:ferrous iron transporter B [Plantactinospora sp. WMMB334]|uniref:ferrous iron transporter B n=1 Tax=Plantactinospora sp. WMMB334 TaxID=3404119 RepID=UPI003B92AB15
MSRHGSGSIATSRDTRRFAIVGGPNSGKTTLFNALTGLRAKTGNYPGVTVARYVGHATAGDARVLIEDLPGTYSLDALSPDEVIVTEVVDTHEEYAGTPTPDGLVVLLDATALQRSLGLLAHVLQTGLPTLVVLTFGDDLARRGGGVDTAALSAAIGVRVIPIVSGHRVGVAALCEALAEVEDWPAPPVLPPVEPAETTGWIRSVLTRAGYRAPRLDARTRRIDAVLLHPVIGTAVFFATMFLFFQTIFTVAAPLQGYIETFFGWLGGLASERIANPWLASLVSDALFGGVGGVLVFLPQIALLFILIALLEGVGYMSRAAFLMDRVMGSVGLEGRAFVALLSSVACAIPGIMATRTLPSARDRIATMMVAPLMTCAARLPVYVLLVGMLVPAESRVGPFGAQGSLMFGLYLLGAVAAMTAGWVFAKLGGRGSGVIPFYMEMPSYRLPRLKTVAAAVREACFAFVRKVGTIILVTTVVLWALLNLPIRGDADLAAAGVDPTNDTAVSAHVVENSYAADLGRALNPVFEPLGFDWRINVGVLSSLAAREVFVATVGQVAAAEDPEDPAAALEAMTVSDGPREGEPLFTPAAILSLLVFFVFALQCMSTVGALRRETGTWRWPAVAFGYMFVLAWVASFIAHTVVSAVI